MKGIVFNLFEQFVEAALGPGAFGRACAEAKLQTTDPFVGPGNYPDEDLIELLSVTCRQHDLGAEAALESFGRFAFAKLAGATPQFVAPFRHPKPFLLTLGSVVHAEVKKLYPHAEPPELTTEDTGHAKLRLTYRSKRGMASLALGLLHGVGEHFGVPHTITVSERDPQGRGARFDLEFANE